jgi:hypothetical protein
MTAISAGHLIEMPAETQHIPAKGEISEVIMNSLEPRQTVWLERGMALGATLRGLQNLLAQAPKPWVRRSLPANAIK